MFYLGTAAPNAPTIDKSNLIIASLFANGEAGAWFSATPSYTYQDTAKTTLVAANGDAAQLIADRSGNGNDITYASDNSRPAGVWWDNGVNMPILPDGGGVYRTCKFKNLALNGTFSSRNLSGGMICEPNGGVSSGYAGLISFHTTGSTPEVALCINSSTSRGHVMVTDTVVSHNQVLIPTSRRMVITWRFTATDTILRVNGTEHSLGAPNSNFTITRIDVGGTVGNADRGFRVKELVLRNEDIGQDGILLLEEALRTKAGAIDLTTTLDLVGDSLGVGQGSETYRPWPVRLTGIDGWAVRPWCYSGEPMYVAKATASNLVARKGSSKAIAMLWMGTNDILVYSRTAQQTYDAIKAYCNTLRAGGIYVIAANLQQLPPAYDTIAQGVNTLIAGDSSFADRIVDVRSVFPAYNDYSVHQADGVHFKDAGNVPARAEFQDALDDALVALA